MVGQPDVNNSLCVSDDLTKAIKDNNELNATLNQTLQDLNSI